MCESCLYCDKLENGCFCSWCNRIIINYNYTLKREEKTGFYNFCEGDHYNEKTRV